MWKLLAGAAAVCVFAGLPMAGQSRSQQFSGNHFYQFTTRTSAFQQMGSWRLEFRITDFRPQPRDQGVFGNGNNPCYLLSNSVRMRCRTWQGSSEVIDFDLNGRKDVRFRVQRDNGAGTFLVELWNGDGSDYLSAGYRIQPGVYNGQDDNNFIGAYYGKNSEFSGSIAFVRWYSTLAPRGGRPPLDGTRTPGDLLNVEFEGEAVDTGRLQIALNFQGTGQPAYTTTPTYPPVLTLKAPAAPRAGSVFDMDLNDSYSMNGFGELASLQLQQTAGPLPLEIEGVSAGIVQTVLPVSGTYTIQLTLRDTAGLETKTVQELAAIATDDDGRLTPFDSSAELVLGPMLRSGASPWKWFDATEKSIADALIATFPALPGDTLATGTISVTNGSATVSGSGTNFIGDSACNGTDTMIVIYEVAGAPGTYGRRGYGIASCASNTSLTLTENYSASTGTQSGRSFAIITNAVNAGWVNGSNNWNYYDAVVALYRLYYRTGNTTYRDAARSLADKWWVYPIDGGRGSVAGARSVALFGLMLRANDGKPEYWPGIVNTAQANYNVWLAGYYPYQPKTDIGEIREQGYAAMWTMLLAILHPDAGVRATWLANANLARDYFLANQTEYGGWKFSLDPSQNYYGFGNFPWQGFALMQFLRMNHEVTGSSAAKASLKSYIDYILAEGIDSSNDGGFYEDTRFTFCPDYGSEKTGAVTVTNGSRSVTGSGTQFQSQYSCNGTDTIAIQDSTGYRRGYTVASCSSQTSMTLGAPYAGATESGRRILRYAGAGTTPPSACHSSYGTVPANMSNARTLLNALHWSFGWAYSNYGTNSYLTTGDRLFAQNLGLGGPGNDGTVGHYNDVISGGSAPRYLANTYLSKEFGFVGGVGGAQNYLSWRLGKPAEPNWVDVEVPYPALAKDAGGPAASVRLILLHPNGRQEGYDCAESVCKVRLDTRRGFHMTRVQYLAADGTVIAETKFERLRL